MQPSARHARGRHIGRLQFWLATAMAVTGFAAVAFVVGLFADGLSLGLPWRADERTRTEPSPRPDAHLENATISQFRDDGTLHYRLRVDEATTFDRGRTVELASALMDYFPPDDQTWRIEAPAGTISEGIGDALGARADLAGGVMLSRAAGADAVRLTTEALTLYPARELVRGHQPAVIERGRGGEMRAGRFEVDLTSGRIHMHASADRPVTIVVHPAEFR